MKLRAGALASPYVIGIGLLIVLPLCFAAYLAFTEYSALQPPRFIGLDNFERMTRDGLLHTAISNSLIYVLIAVPLRLGLAVGLALLLYRSGRGVGAARAVVYLPSVIPEAAYGLLWLWILNPIYGPIAAVTGSLGMESTGLLTDPWSTRVAIAVMGAFQIGEAFVVALAARRTIPAGIYEAAALEGASPWLVTRRVTLPLMAPILGLLALRDVMVSLQSNFVAALIVTEGGPRYATTFLPYHLYKQAFTYFRFGYAAAVSISLVVITALAIAVAIRIGRRRFA